MLGLHFWIILGEYRMPLRPFSPRLLRLHCRDGEHSSSTSATLKRRIQALILFVSTSLTPSEPGALDSREGGSTTDIITHLLDLATPPTGYATESDVVTIATVAQAAIERVVSVISAREFLAAGRVMLASEDTRVRLFFNLSLNGCGRTVFVLDQSGGAWRRFRQNPTRH